MIVNDVEPDPAVLVAATVTGNVPAAVGVPDTVPVPEPIVRPGGSPLADQVYVPAGDAVSVNGVIAVPTVPVLLPGLATVTVPPPIVQVGSADCAGTETASQAAFTVLKLVQEVGNRFLAAFSVAVR